MKNTSANTQDNYNNNPSKDIKLWIITEGLIGTENQCLGVAAYLDNVEVCVKRISLKFPFNYLCPLIIKRPPLWAFKGDDLRAPWPDMILASGRKAVGAALSIPHGFKVFIQNPRVNPDLFDLVAVPAHDNVTGDNVIVTKGAPNKITSQSLAQAKDQFKEIFTDMPERKIVLIIGGNSKTHTLPANFAHNLYKKLLPYIQSGEYGFMITASRRTPKNIADDLKNLFSGSQCYFWDGTGDNPYHAFLAMADTLLVTEDSTSMLSDALTSGKPTYRIPLDGGSAKFDRLYKALESQGGLRVFDGTLETWDYPRLNDAKLIADEIKKRFANNHNAH